MAITPPILRTDYYKTIHHNLYPENTTQLTYYWTARSSRVDGVNEVVFFGLQAFLNRLNKDFKEGFFSRRKQNVIQEYAQFMENTLGPEYADTKHIEKLYDLGYLPLSIRAVPEGTVVPIGVPMLEIENTKPEFFWLPGFLETFLSCSMWHPITSATTARRYYQYLMTTYLTAGEPVKKVPLACSDFSMRGMTSLESAEASGAGHLLFFKKTANIPAVNWMMENYGGWGQFMGAGTPSTEHSVMCAYEHDELNAFRTVMQRYPKGNLSIVSDTYNLWDVVCKVLPQLKNEILTRDGTIIIRPDSGDPADIICGDPEWDMSTYTIPGDGLVVTLWNIFGGETNTAGYKLLDRHIRVIYGDSITYERCKDICARLMQKGFSPANVSFGIGSYTYQYVTRDTFGFALKATHAVINGEDKMLYKDPITDHQKLKRSHRGKCVVFREGDIIKYWDNLTNDDARQMNKNLLELVYLDGTIFRFDIYENIKNRCMDGI